MIANVTQGRFFCHTTVTRGRFFCHTGATEAGAGPDESRAVPDAGPFSSPSLDVTRGRFFCHTAEAGAGLGVPDGDYTVPDAAGQLSRPGLDDAGRLASPGFDDRGQVWSPILNSAGPLSNPGLNPESISFPVSSPPMIASVGKGLESSRGQTAVREDSGQSPEARITPGSSLGQETVGTGSPAAGPSVTRGRFFCHTGATEAGAGPDESRAVPDGGPFSSPSLDVTWGRFFCHTAEAGAGLGVPDGGLMVPDVAGQLSRPGLDDAGRLASPGFDDRGQVWSPVLNSAGQSSNPGLNLEAISFRVSIPPLTAAAGKGLESSRGQTAVREDSGQFPEARITPGSSLGQETVGTGSTAAGQLLPGASVAGMAPGSTDDRQSGTEGSKDVLLSPGRVAETAAPQPDVKPAAAGENMRASALKSDPSGQQARQPLTQGPPAEVAARGEGLTAPFGSTGTEDRVPTRMVHGISRENRAAGPGMDEKIPPEESSYPRRTHKAEGSLFSQGNDATSEAISRVSTSDEGPKNGEKEPAVGAKGIKFPSGPLETGANPPVEVRTDPQDMSGAEHRSAVRQAGEAAQEMVRSGRSEMRVRLRPEDLGGITIRLVAENGSFSLKIIADNPHTGHMLAGGVSDLASSLREQGIAVSRAEVIQAGTGSLQLSGGGYSGGGYSTQQRPFSPGREQNHPAWTTGPAEIRPAYERAGAYRISVLA